VEEVVEVVEIMIHRVQVVAEVEEVARPVRLGRMVKSLRVVMQDMVVVGVRNPQWALADLVAMGERMVQAVPDKREAREGTREREMDLPAQMVEVKEEALMSPFILEAVEAVEGTMEAEVAKRDTFLIILKAGEVEEEEVVATAPSIRKRPHEPPRIPMMLTMREMLDRVGRVATTQVAVLAPQGVSSYLIRAVSTVPQAPSVKRWSSMGWMSTWTWATVSPSQINPSHFPFG
jgi:hypothetical protein